MAATPGRAIGADELRRHRSEKDCWVAFHGTVYDVTEFMQEHPGGKRAILSLAGYDGTAAYSAIHSKSLLERLPPSSILGVVDPKEAPRARPPLTASSVSVSAGFLNSCFGGLFSSAPSRPKQAKDSGNADGAAPTLDEVVNLNDFEALAQRRMQQSGYDYYASAACDEVTKVANESAFRRAWLRPRVMVDVSSVDISTTLLGCRSSFPVFVSPCAMAGLAHEQGELGIARAAAKQGVVQVIANMASRDLEEIVGAGSPSQRQWFQAYINPDRPKTEEKLRKVVAMGISVICITVDTNVLGRRERDVKNKIKDRSQVALVQRDEKPTTGGMAGALGAFTDARLSWTDLPWLRSIVGEKVKLVLKGVQTGEDAVIAAQRGVDGIIISNHGGRQLDQARPTLDILVEATSALKVAGLAGKMEVFVDGGVRRGTDVYKALSLGASAVGVGRPTLYALAFGEAGVDKCLGILRDELLNCMQLMGRRSLSDISERDVVFQPLSGGRT